MTSARSHGGRARQAHGAAGHRRDRRRLRRHRHEPAVHAAPVFTGAHALPLTPANVLGILSIIFWALIIVVTLKYVTLIMRADNRGEGGILALTALVSRGIERHARGCAGGSSGFGIFGAAMFYGDGMITPAISVLGAVEGLEIIAPQLHPFIVPVDARDHRRAVRDPEARHRARRRAVRPGDVRVVRRARRARASSRSRSEPAVLARAQSAVRDRVRRGNPAASRSSRSAPSCSRSPAPRRSTPTWGISARRRSAAHGSCS